MTPKCRRRVWKKDEPLTLFKLRRCPDSGPDESPEDTEAAFQDWDWCSDEWACCAQTKRVQSTCGERPSNKTDTAWNEWNFWKKTDSTNSFDEAWIENLKLDDDDVEGGKETSESVAAVQSDWDTMFHCKEEMKKCGRASAIKSEAGCDRHPGSEECGQETRHDEDTLCSFSYGRQCASVGEDIRDNCRSVEDNTVSLTGV